MSKIAEKKALKKYPELDGYIGNIPLKEAYNYARNGYSDGYDQAMQDFLEKACEWLEDTKLENFICRDDGIYFENEKFVEQFKNYMKNESEKQ